MTLAVKFASSAAKDAGASDPTNGIFALIKANLAAGFSVNGSGHIEHTNSRTGLVDPAGGIHSWSFPDILDGTDYLLPLPSAVLVSNFAAILDGLDGLTTPPTGFSELPVADPVTPDNPGMSFGFGGPIYYENEQIYLNLIRQGSSNKMTISGVDTFQNDLISAGYVDANGDVQTIPAGASTYEELLVDYELDAAGEAALADGYTFLWDNVGEFEPQFTGWANSAGTGSGRTADLVPTTAAVSYAKVTATPVVNRALVRTDHVNLYKAGLDFNPNVMTVYREARHVRVMDLNGANHSPVTAVSDFPPRSYNGSWCWGDLDTYPYYGPPLEIQVELAILCNSDLHICIPHQLPDSEITTFVEYVRDNLPGHLCAWFELSNEAWNTLFEQAGWMNARGIELYNKAALAAGDASSGYQAGDVVTGSGWTVTIDTVSVGVPATWRVTGRSSPSSSSSVAMSGGSGSGLVMDFTNYGGNGDNPIFNYFGFRMAEVADLIRTAYAGNFGSTGRVAFGGQAADSGKWTFHWKPGFEDWANGMAGHPDYPPAGATGDAVSDLIHAVVITNYYGGTVDANDLDGWIAQGQTVVNANLSALVQSSIANLSAVEAWRTICDSEGVFLGCYEGGSHTNLQFIDGTQAQNDALAAYHVSDIGIADRQDALTAYKAAGCHWLSQFVCISTAKRGKPWCCLDWPGDEGDPRWSVVKARNLADAGGDWDAGRSSGFGAGPIFGCRDFDGSVGGDSSPLMIGGKMTIAQGDGTNVAIAAGGGIFTDCDQVICEGVQGDYTWQTGPNGCKEGTHATLTFVRLHPTEVSHVRFKGSFGKVAVSAL